MILSDPNPDFKVTRLSDADYEIQTTEYEHALLKSVFRMTLSDLE